MASKEPSGAMDFAYLEGFAGGDRQVVDEVLALFLVQAQAWGPGLSPANSGWRDLVHTIKGSARGIGANALGDVCAQAEVAGEGDLAAVREALDAVVAAIEAYRA